jgi:hypothetical protein
MKNSYVALLRSPRSGPGTVWLTSAEFALWQRRLLSGACAQAALQLVHLNAERGSPKYERAAMRWLERYLNEGTPRLQNFAEIATLASREPES